MKEGFDAPESDSPSSAPGLAEQLCYTNVIDQGPYLQASRTVEPI